MELTRKCESCKSPARLYKKRFRGQKYNKVAHWCLECCHLWWLIQQGRVSIGFGDAKDLAPLRGR